MHINANSAALKDTCFHTAKFLKMKLTVAEFTGRSFRTKAGVRVNLLYARSPIVTGFTHTVRYI